MKKWTAVSYDVSRLLQAVPAKRVKIPANLKLDLVIELEDAAYAILSKDPTWLQKMHDRANTKALPVLAELKKKIADADQKAGGFDAKAADIFSRDLNAFIKQAMDAAGPEMAKEIDRFFEEYKKGKKDLLNYRLKSGFKIAFNAISIVGSVAVAVVSHGTLSAFSIAGIVKSALGISQECVKLALNADQMATLIRGEFATLKKVMVDDLAKAKTSGKIAQGVKEVGLNVLSGALGVETPALRNCKAHIEAHKVDITKLEKESKRLSEQIYKAMDEQEDWTKKFAAAKKTMPVDKVRKIAEGLKKSEEALDQMIKGTIEVNVAVERAQQRQEKFEKTIAAMMKGIPEWLGYVQELTALAIAIGPNVGNAEQAIEKALGAVQSAEKQLRIDAVLASA